MTDKQWQILLDLIDGKAVTPLPAGFIIDSPWIPGWAGITTLDYFTSDERWFETNLRACSEFPDAIFLPGFWSEYGMCTEPSAFGVKCVWQQHEPPFADKLIDDVSEIDSLGVPNPATDGLCPFVLNRLKNCRRRIENAGHKIRFAVARGPLNIASFLMGTTEFLMAMRTDPDNIHKLLECVTDFTVRWLKLQKESFDTIDGILILDDIVGFCGEPDFKGFAEPYLTRIFAAFPASVRAFHNDADGRVCAPHLATVGINVFNFSFLHSLQEMRDWTHGEVVLLGNIPPRDVLAGGTPEQVRQSVRQALAPLEDSTGVLMSCGGGMPDSVPGENIQAFIKACTNNTDLCEG